MIPLTGGIENSQIHSQKIKSWLPGAGVRKWGDAKEIRRGGSRDQRSAIRRVRGPVHHLLMSISDLLGPQEDSQQHKDIFILEVEKPTVQFFWCSLLKFY